MIKKIDLEVTQNNFEESNQVSSLEALMKIENIVIISPIGLTPFSDLIVGHKKNYQEKRLEFFNKNTVKDFEKRNSAQPVYSAYSLVKKGLEIEMLNLILEGNVNNENINSKLKEAIEFFSN